MRMSKRVAPQDQDLPQPSKNGAEEAGAGPLFDIVR